MGDGVQWNRDGGSVGEWGMSAVGWQWWIGVFWMQGDSGEIGVLEMIIGWRV